MPKIIVQFGGEEWTVDLREGVNVAGRSPQAAIPIKDASMSREHCDIVFEGGVATVVDRGSMNGTLVNGSRMDRKVLVAGDRIQIGKASLHFEKKAGGASASAAKSEEQPVVGIDDFSVWRRESGGMMKGVVALVVLVVVGVGAVFLFKSLGRGESIAVDPANLLGATGRFEPGPDKAVVGWVMKQGLASRIQAIEGPAKEGKSCLQLDKSGANTDMVAEIVLQEVLAAPAAGTVEVSTWVRAESSNILPALKVSWLGARKGPMVLEEASEPVAASSDWTQVNHVFTPPPGATFLQLSLIAVGRAGRVFFDDVRVRAGSGGTPPKSIELGAFEATASPAGILNIGKGTGRILNNLQIFLASDKEGSIHQVAATGGRVEADGAAKKLIASGKLQSPVDMRPVEYEIEVRGNKDGLLLGYRLRGDALKQVDRLGLSLLLPGADLKGDYTNPVSRLWFRAGAPGDYILEISDGLMRVTADWVPEARRVVLAVPVPKGAAEVAFGFLLKTGSGGSADQMVAADEAIKQARMSDAVAILKDLLAVTREEQKRTTILTKLKSLEEIESTDWKNVIAQGFRAGLVGLKPQFEDALQKLDQYEKRWPGGKRAEAAKAERAKLQAGLAAAAEDKETVRAHRLVDRAEEHRKEGRKKLARELCESVRRHYASTSAAERAAELLKSLGSE